MIRSLCNCLLKRPQRKSKSLLIPITLHATTMIPRVSQTNQMVKNNSDHEDNEIIPTQEPASARRMRIFHPSLGVLGSIALRTTSTAPADSVPLSVTNVTAKN